MEAQWRPFFWEPVEGSGERLMAGVVLCFDGKWMAQRMLRDDVLDCLYGKASADPRRLIDAALSTYLSIAEAGGVDAFSELTEPLMGLHPGKARVTDALSRVDALRHAVLLHSSFAQWDGLDRLEEADVPAPVEVNRRFSTEVREAVVASRPDLARNFGKSARLTETGSPVRFGYLSDKAVLHFSVLHPVRQAASVRDARARLWELSRARETGALARAALVTWVPPAQDPTVGEQQRIALEQNRLEIEREADTRSMSFHAVVTVEEARDRVLAVAG
jgi:hypothetical protein